MFFNGFQFLKGKWLNSTINKDIFILLCGSFYEFYFFKDLSHFYGMAQYKHSKFSKTVLVWGLHFSHIKNETSSYFYSKILNYYDVWNFTPNVP